MGQEVLTLADIWPKTPRAMIVGLNPAPASVQAGHYYQGGSGRRQLGRLIDEGILADPHGPFFEASATDAGIGFTDIVKRPTPNEKLVGKAELEYGTATLERALAVHQVPLVICVYRHPAKVLLGGKPAPGLQTQRTSWGGRVFRLPGPYERSHNAAEVMGELRRALDQSD